MIKKLIVSFALLSFSAPLIAEETAHIIKWDSLVPTTQPLEDPFKDLTEDQLYDLESIVYFREVNGRTGPINSEDTEDILNLTANLKSANLDVDTLLLTYEKYSKEINRRSWLVTN